MKNKYELMANIRYAMRHGSLTDEFAEEIITKIEELREVYKQSKYDFTLEEVQFLQSVSSIYEHLSILASAKRWMKRTVTAKLNKIDTSALAIKSLNYEECSVLAKEAESLIKATEEIGNILAKIRL